GLRGSRREGGRPPRRRRSAGQGLAGELVGATGNLWRPGDLEHAPSDVAEVLDRRGGAAGDADDALAIEDARIGQVGLALDLDPGLAGDADEPGQLLLLRARPPAP